MPDKEFGEHFARRGKADDYDKYCLRIEANADMVVEKLDELYRKDLDVAVSWCREQGLEFDAINDNLLDVIQKYGINSRKISCDFYIDDKVIAGNVYKLLERCA